MSYILKLSLYSFILYDNKINEEHCKLTTNEAKKRDFFIHTFLLKQQRVKVYLYSL
jgi:hypothetical protein